MTNKPPAVKELPASLIPIRDRELSEAACAGHSPLFDESVHGESKDQRHARHQQAAQICHRCPIERRCKEFAYHLRTDHRHGVFGAVLFEGNAMFPIPIGESNAS